MLVLTLNFLILAGNRFCSSVLLQWAELTLGFHPTAYRFSLSKNDATDCGKLVLKDASSKNNLPCCIRSAFSLKTSVSSKSWRKRVSAVLLLFFMTLIQWRTDSGNSTNSWNLSNKWMRKITKKYVKYHITHFTAKTLVNYANR